MEKALHDLGQRAARPSVDGRVALVASMGRSTHNAITIHVRCPCTRWEWREIVAGTGVVALERTCPRCRRRRLLIVRRSELVAIVRLYGRDLGSFRQALEEVGALRESEREELLGAVLPFIRPGAS